MRLIEDPVICGLVHFGCCFRFRFKNKEPDLSLIRFLNECREHLDHYPLDEWKYCHAFNYYKLEDKKMVCTVAICEHPQESWWALAVKAMTENIRANAKTFVMLDIIVRLQPTCTHRTYLIDPRLVDPF